MAVPKRRMSRSNTRSRRAQWKAAAVQTVTCANPAVHSLAEVVGMDGTAVGDKVRVRFPGGAAASSGGGG